MSDVYRWQAGEHLMVAGRTGVVLLDPQIGVQLAEKVFEELQRGATLGAILQLLTQAYDLWTIPPFVIALRDDDDLQVVVRGPMQVRVGGADGEERMSGKGVSTWTERLFEQVRSFSVAWNEHVDGPTLPVTGAVLWAGSISWGQTPEPDQRAPLTGAARSEPPGPRGSSPLPAAAPLAAPADHETPREPPGIQAPIVRSGADAEPAPEPASEPDPEPEPEPTQALDAVDVPQPAQAGEPDGGDGRDALQEAVSLTRDDPGPAPSGEAPDPPEGDGEQPASGTPDPTAVFPAVAPAGPGDPAAAGGGQPRPTGSETLSEVDWDVPPHSRPGPSEPAGEPPPTPADLLSGPVWGAPGEEGAREQEQIPWEGARGGDTESSPNLGAKLLGRLLGTPADEAEPTVLALLCPNGHPSPPHTSFCSECGQRLTGTPTRVPRPSLGLLTMPDGEVVVLTRSVIVGRAPSAERSSTRDEPRLLTVASPNQEISRSHVEICLEGWSVLARDLGSSNGTLLVRDAAAPVKLPQASPLQLQSGDVLDLGEGVSLNLSELP